MKDNLAPEVMKAFNHLSEENDIIVIEGAGSPAEINLAENDIVNMGMAKMADAPVILVADIDRGGVFASAYGTIKLLPVEDQERFCGIVINKFRGDVDILKPGLAMLEDLTGKPVLVLFRNMSMNSRSCLRFFKYCFGIEKSKSTHIPSMFYSVRVMHFLTKKLESSTDSDNSCCSCCADNRTF